MRANGRDTEPQQQRRHIERQPLWASEFVMRKLSWKKSWATRMWEGDWMLRPWQAIWRLPRILESHISSSGALWWSWGIRALSTGSCAMSVTRSDSFFLAMCPTQDLKPRALLFLFNSPGAFPPTPTLWNFELAKSSKNVLKYIVYRDILSYSYFKIKVIS